MVLLVEGLEGHAVVAHGVRPMLAESGVMTPLYLPILLAPIDVDRIFLG